MKINPLSSQPSPSEDNNIRPATPLRSADKKINQVALLRLIQTHPEQLAELGINERTTRIAIIMSSNKSHSSNFAKLIEKLGNWFHGLGYLETGEIIVSGLQKVEEARDIFVNNLFNELNPKQELSESDIKHLETFDYKECQFFLQDKEQVKNTALKTKLTDLKQRYVGAILNKLNKETRLDQSEQEILYAFDKEDWLSILTLSRRSQMETIAKAIIQYAEQQANNSNGKSSLLENFLTTCLGIMTNQDIPMIQDHLSLKAVISYSCILNKYDHPEANNRFEMLEATLPQRLPELSLEQREKIKVLKHYHENTLTVESLNGFAAIVDDCLKLIKRKEGKSKEISKLIQQQKTSNGLQSDINSLSKKYENLTLRFAWHVYYLVKMTQELEDGKWEELRNFIQSTIKKPEFIREFNEWASRQKHRNRQLNSSVNS